MPLTDKENCSFIRVQALYSGNPLRIHQDKEGNYSLQKAPCIKRKSFPGRKLWEFTFLQEGKDFEDFLGLERSIRWIEQSAYF